jgi:phospholipid/cholesterol/gamma-HCH transport system substrate-binding protein
MPAKKHDFTMTEIKAGAVVTVSVLALALLVAAILGLRPRPVEKTFYTDFSDIMGLNVGGDVRFGGFKVGRVIDIERSPDDRSKLRIYWSVAEDTSVNTESRASISYVSLVSDMHLEVSQGSARAALVEAGSLVPSSTSAGGMLGGIKDLAVNVGSALGEDGIIGDLRKFLGVRQAEANAEHPLVSIAELVAHTDSITTEGSALVADLRTAVNANAKTLEEILGRLKDVEEGAKELLGHLNGVIAENRDDVRSSVAGTRELVTRASRAVEALEKATTSLETLVTNLAAASENARGLLAESRPELEDLITDLRETVRNLRRFSRIMAEEPQALIRGRSPEGRE